MNPEDSIDDCKWMVSVHLPDSDLTGLDRLLGKLKTSSCLKDICSGIERTAEGKTDFVRFVDFLETYSWNPHVVEGIAGAFKSFTHFDHPTGELFELYDVDYLRKISGKLRGEVVADVCRRIGTAVQWGTDISTLLDVYGSDEFADLMNNCQEYLKVNEHVLQVSQYDESTNLVFPYVCMLSKYAEKEYLRLAVRVRRIYSENVSVEEIKELMGVLTEVNLGGTFSEECCDYFCNNKKEQNLSFAEKVLGQKEFLSRQEKEVAFPLAAILARTEDRYFPHLLSMGTGDRGNLAQAYSIAKANIDEDTGKNYLEEFYSGVKGMLETRPDDLGRWAESICSDFRKQGELGLLRGVVG